MNFWRARIAAINLLQIDLNKSLHYVLMILVCKGTCAPVAPPFNGQGGSAPVMHPRSGVPVCDIHIFSATTTAEALLFSIQELTIVQNSGHVPRKFCVFFVQRKFYVAFSCENKILRVFSWYSRCSNFFRSSVSATKISMNRPTIRPGLAGTVPVLTSIPVSGPG